MNNYKHTDAFKEDSPCVDESEYDINDYRKVVSVVNTQTVNQMIKDLKDTSNVSDGYHTFGELYEHRHALWIKLAHYEAVFGRLPVWKSDLHSDGTKYDGWFLLGIGILSGQQMTYHLPDKYWDACDFADYRDRAPKFDGHTCEMVRQRVLAM